MDLKFQIYLLVPVLILCVVSITGAANVSVTDSKNTTEHKELSAAEKWKLSDKLLRDLSSKAVKTILPYAVRNSGKLNVTSGCIGGLMKLMIGVKKTKLWAFRMLDAFGKIPSGMLRGSINSLGDYDLCIDTEAPDQSFRGQYCSVDISPALPPRTPFMTVDNPIPEFENISHPDSVMTEIASKARGLYRFKIRNAVCIPSTCTRDDVQNLASSVVEASGLEFKVMIPNCETKKEKITFGPSEIAIICILSILLFIVAVGTLKDVIFKLRYGDDESYKQDLGTATKCLLCFSFYSNTVRLLKKDRNPDSIKIFHGMKAITLLWIIFSHVYVFITYQAMSHVYGAREFSKDRAFGIIEQGHTAVQTFFFISATLVSYGVTKMKGRNINIFMYVFRRYWRLTPPLMFVIACVFLVPYLGSGPVWKETIDEDLAQKCKDNWWYNILYISNFLQMKDMCLTWSWYIPVDTQLYLISLLVLIPLKRNVSLGLAINVGLLVLTTAMAAFFQSYYEVPPVITVVHDYPDDVEKVSAVIYLKPHVHFPSYCVGIFVGYFLATKKKLQIPLCINLLGWIVSFTAALTLVYGVHDWNQGNLPGQFTATLFICTEKLAWSLALAWVTITCMTGNGGFARTILCWDAFVPIGRLTYMTYIIHPVIQYIHIGSAKDVERMDHRTMVTRYLTYTVLAFICSYPMSMLFEAPFGALEKIMLASKNSPKTEEREDAEVEVPSYFTANGVHLNGVKKTDENGINLNTINIDTT